MSSEVRTEYAKMFRRGWELIRKLPSAEQRGDKPLGWFAARHVKAAKELFDKCYVLEPDDSACLWALGKLEQAIANHVNALEWFEKALEQQRDNLELIREASYSAMVLGRGERAEQLCRHAVDLEPNNQDLMANYALALLLNKQGRRALGVATNAFKLNPEEGFCREVLAYAKKVVDGKEDYPEHL
ncbi:MAG: hypothetical protein QGI45_13785 [Myxococcota bacterium]|nr:hypothetical protein [Myxococcota bacterium]